MFLIETAYAAGNEVSNADAGLMATLGIDIKMLIMQFINLAIVFAILWFLILKPLSKKLSERQQIIDEGLENSKKIDSMLKKSESDYKDQMLVAKTEANTILEKGKKDAEETAENIKENTRKEIEGMIDSAKKNIESERQKMVVEFKKDAAEIIALSLKKILGKNFDSSKDEQSIKESLEGIKE